MCTGQSVRRAHQREKKRKKRETAKLENRERVSRKKLKKNSMENSSCRISVAIDCSFDNEMSERVIFGLSFIDANTVYGCVSMVLLEHLLLPLNDNV